MRHRRNAVVGRVAGHLCLALLPLAVAAAEPDLALGESIYLQGRLPSGEPVRSITQGDIELSGNQVSCASCHKRSGQGTAESRLQVPAVTSAALYERREIGRREQTLQKFRAMDNSILMGSHRPVFTEDDVYNAIVKGVDPTGRRLELMPRYQLTRAQVDGVIAYMRTLSAQLSPGVTDKTINFATVIAGKVDATKRKAMLDAITTYFEMKNANTRNETERAERGPWHKEPMLSAYRKWELHTWELSGDSDSWGKQLAELYAKQPVFALIGGLTGGSWAPMHDFCVNNRVPCLLPNASYLSASDDDFYNVYFYRGTLIEAHSLAAYIKDGSGGGKPLLQVYHAGAEDAISAAALREAMNGGAQVTDIAVPEDRRIDSEFWQALSKEHSGADLVLWLPAADLQDAAKALAGNGRIYLSGSLLADSFDHLPQDLRAQAYMIYPFELPSKRLLVHTRTVNWARLWKIDYTDETIIANSYFMLSMVTDIVKHLQNNLYRDYFMERAEHMPDRATTPSVFPRVSLAPGQRFLSKGSYIVKFDAASKDGIVPVSDWITP